MPCKSAKRTIEQSKLGYGFLHHFCVVYQNPLVIFAFGYSKLQDVLRFCSDFMPADPVFHISF